jgi:multiple sugar transport system ATP-binding protein
MGAVSVRDIAIGFGDVSVISHMSLEIAKGEFIVLLGPSGCGKSTLLNAIAGLIDIKEGQVWIDGQNVTWSEPKDRGIGMVFQSYSLYPRMSVEQNLSFGLRIAKVPKDDIAARVAKASKLLQLDPLLQRKPSELSGGQRQRVAIGRALVRNVGVFLFDEPLSNLDAKLRNELRVEIKKLHQDIGNTMIYVTHDQIEALTLADRIAVMKSGVIQQLASPHDIYHHPANLFVAGFIGSPGMNMIPGKLVAAPDVACAYEGGSAEMARYPFAKPPVDGQSIVLGVRPEHIALGAAPAGCHGAKGVVTIVEPMGAETILWTSFANQTTTIRVDGDSAVKVGDEIAFWFDVARASAFDTASGNRL